MELKLIDKKEKTTERGTHFARETYAIGDYTVMVDDALYGDGTSSHDITVCTPRNSAFDHSYIPEIYYSADGIFTKNPRAPRFRVQTTSYGSLGPDEFRMFLEAQQRALEVVEVLTRELIEKGENDD